MVVNQDICSSLLRRIDEYLSLIHGMKLSKEDLLANRDTQHLLERRLHLVIESSIDLAGHIASALKLPGRTTASEVFRLLGEEDVIPKELADKMRAACGFRNLIVHEYAKIDYELIFNTYQSDLADVKAFAVQIHSFLMKN